MKQTNLWQTLMMALFLATLLAAAAQAALAPDDILTTSNPTLAEDNLAALQKVLAEQALDDKGRKQE